jgi:uncharacterized protein (TIRG00374 family)
MTANPHAPTSVRPSTPRRWIPRAKTTSLTIAVVLASVLLYYSLRGVEWRQVVRIVRGARPDLLGLTVVVSSGNLLLRSLRWRILLNAEGRVSVPTAFWATAAGYFGNNFLPARAGEIVRTAFISARCRLDYPYVLATALCERIVDAVTLVAIAALVLLTLPTRPGWLADAATPFLIAGLVGVSLIIVLPWLTSFGKQWIERMPLPRPLVPKLIAVLEQAVRGIRAFHDARRLLGFAGLTIVIWSLDAVGTVIGAAALGLSIPLSVAFLLIAALGLGSALPSTPGYVGIYQIVAVTVLPPFGLSRTDAIAYIIVAQALAYVVIGFWGAIGLLQYRRNGRSGAQPPDEGRHTSGQ